MKTVYIIGAGASQEAGLPTGELLKTHIEKLLDIGYDTSFGERGDKIIAQALRGYSRRKNPKNNVELYDRLCKECNFVKNNMHKASSIDNFLDSNRDREYLALCGKLGIVKAIMDAEQNSDLCKGANYSSLKNSWHVRLFRNIVENRTFQEVGCYLEDLYLIIFNYDRCVEHYLHESFMEYYGVESKEAASLVESITVVHPYGVIGSLPWQKESEYQVIGFAAGANENYLVDQALGISTFTERAGSDVVKEMKNILLQSDRLVFLGFAYHPLNMKLLGTHDGEPKNFGKTKMCYASAYGMSDSDIGVAKSAIESVFQLGSIHVEISGFKCVELFDGYSLSLRN